VLITGKNSYVGTSVENWLMKEPDKYYVESISVRGEEWKSFDFSTFDVVLHVAGIAHIKETKKNSSEFFRINRDLTFELANTCKSQKVKNFVFISTMSVYGLIGSIKKVQVIDANTIEKPNNYYGLSKLEAEKKISKLIDENFKIAIIRPPMIYGINSPGNYNRLLNFFTHFAVIPNIKNIRSAIKIDKFIHSFVKLINSDFDSGIYIFQDEKYWVTNQVLTQYFKKNKIIIFYSNLLSIFIITFLKRLKTINKVYGNLIYKKTFTFKKIKEMV
jgi:UDP-glucose 4-epimerase